MRNTLLKLVGCILLLNVVKGIEITDGDNTNRVDSHYPVPEGGDPFMVFITDPNNKVVCGGTLISPTKILTAASCIPRAITPNTVTGYKATMNTISLTSRRGRVRRNVISSILPGDYVYMSTGNNVAIATLDNPVDNVPVIGLGYDTIPPVGTTTAIVAGWGYRDPEKVTNILHHSYITVVPNSQCTAAYDNPMYNFGFYFCVSSYYTGVCEADVGGPIFYNGQQVGIVVKTSYCDRGTPIVVVAVNGYKEWIQQNSS